MTDWQERRRCAQQNHAYKAADGWHIPDTSVLGIITLRNGTVAYKLRCRLCGAPSGSLPSRVAEKLIQQGRTVEWRQDNTASFVSEYRQGLTFDADHCCVHGCENIGIEYHHFAPRNIFPDADNWPYLPVCLAHHRYWHRMMSDYAANAKTPEQFFADGQ